MIALEAHDVVVIVGIRGTGKSYRAREIFREHRGAKVVWDPHGEYRDAEQRYTVGELLDHLEILHRSNLSLAVMPSPSPFSDDPMAATSAEFVEFCRLIATMRNTLCVIDEVGILQGAALKQLEWMATQSRHWGVPLVLVAQRAVQIPVTAREQASRIISLRQIRKEDIRALAERIGDERAAAINKLPRRECVTWNESDSFEPEERTTPQ